MTSTPCTQTLGSRKPSATRSRNDSVASAPPPEEAPKGPEPQESLTSPTLGELYFNQGFTDKAIEVYRALSAREPGNERLAARLRELEAVQKTLGAPPAGVPPPAPAADPAGERRQAIERTIGRLEGLLAAIRKG